MNEYNIGDRVRVLMGIPINMLGTVTGVDDRWVSVTFDQPVPYQDDEVRFGDRWSLIGSTRGLEKIEDEAEAVDNEATIFTLLKKYSQVIQDVVDNHTGGDFTGKGIMMHFYMDAKKAGLIEED